MKLLKYFSITLFIFTILNIFIFFNIGNILDVSEKPLTSDIIVCLGGGSKERIIKAAKLYTEGYSKKNILILTGDDRSKKRKEKNLPDKRIEYLQNNGFKSINILHNKNIKSTKEEIIYIKKILLKKNYTSVMIISDAPHTRRIKTLISILKIDKDKKLKFNLVASDNNWWNSDTYYTSKRAQTFVLDEILKLGYSYIAYGFFDKLNLLSIIKK